MPFLPPHALLLLFACTPDAGLGDTDGGTSPDGGTSTAGTSTAGTSTDGGSTTDECALYETLAVDPTLEDQGDPEAWGSLAWVENVPAGCAVRLLLQEPGTYRLARSLELRARLTLVFGEGAVLELEPEATLTIRGGIEADRTRIFGDQGTILGPPELDEAWPEWFGAVPDDGLDDALALQRAVDFSPTVELDSGVLDLASTVRLPDGATLRGPAGGAAPAILRSALVYPATEGFYPTRLLEAVDVTQVQLEDLTLDGNRHSTLVDCWAYPETDNLARFEGVSQLTMQSVHLTGYEANWGAEDWSLAQAMAIVDSSDIALVDVQFTDSRTEGILFLDSADIHIERLSTRNTDVWTPLSAFYVDGFSLLDSEIIEDEGTEWSGSTLNVTGRTVLVQGSRFTGGWGLDFGDETGVEPFGVRDIVVEDNEIETVGMSVYFTPYAVGDAAQDVEIRGNRMRLRRGASSDRSDMMIRLDACDGVVIEDNDLVVEGEGEGEGEGDAFVFGMSFQARSEDVRIEGNRLSGVDAGIAHGGDSPDPSSLEIVGNTIDCAEVIRRDSWSGGSTGVWLFHYVAGEFDEVLVEDNDMTCLGGWVSLIDYRSLSGSAAPFVDLLTVTDNRFLPASGPERAMGTEGARSALVEGNTPDWVND